MDNEIIMTTIVMSEFFIIRDEILC